MLPKLCGAVQRAHARGRVLLRHARLCQGNMGNVHPGNQPAHDPSMCCTSSYVQGPTRAVKHSHSYTKLLSGVSGTNIRSIRYQYQEYQVPISGVSGTNIRSIRFQYQEYQVPISGVSGSNIRSIRYQYQEYQVPISGVSGTSCCQEYQVPPVVRSIR
jgi:hypothetical protein